MLTPIHSALAAGTLGEPVLVAEALALVADREPRMDRGHGVRHVAHVGAPRADPPVDLARGTAQRREVAAEREERPPLAKVLAPLGEVVQLVLDQIRSAVKTPDKVTVELGAALKGKSSIVLVSGETEATLKVSLTWENKTQS